MRWGHVAQEAPSSRELSGQMVVSVVSFAAKLTARAGLEVAAWGSTAGACWYLDSRGRGQGLPHFQ